MENIGDDNTKLWQQLGALGKLLDACFMEVADGADVTYLVISGKEQCVRDLQSQISDVFKALGIAEVGDSASKTSTKNNLNKS